MLPPDAMDRMWRVEKALKAAGMQGIQDDPAQIQSLAQKIMSGQATTPGLQGRTPPGLQGMAGSPPPGFGGLMPRRPMIQQPGMMPNPGMMPGMAGGSPSMSQGFGTPSMPGGMMQSTQMPGRDFETTISMGSDGNPHTIIMKKPRQSRGLF